MNISLQNRGKHRDFKIFHPFEFLTYQKISFGPLMTFFYKKTLKNLNSNRKEFFVLILDIQKIVQQIR